MINRKEIKINEGTKGILVYCKKEGLSSSLGWLVLIKNVRKDMHILRISRYMSYEIAEKRTHFDNGREGSWGAITGYKFYEPTMGEKKFIVNQLAKRGFKFVPILNKLIKRKIV